MISQDYILRQIDKFFKALSKVLRHKDAGDIRESIDLIDTSLDDLVYSSDKAFKDLSLDETLFHLISNEVFNAELGYIIADLLYERIMLHKCESNMRYSMQAVVLYKLAMQSNTAAFQIDALDKIHALEQNLPNSSKVQIDIVINKYL
ncbi:MAG: hypothetical protein LAT57_05655 [Balneolales bacterium]|nr:hypothetical protein [Balneolales bacterium]